MTLHTAPTVSTAIGRRTRRIVAGLLVVTGLVTLAYSGLSTYVATVLVHGPPLPITHTPAGYGLAFQPVEFPARVDHLAIKGWFIPGVLGNGASSQLTVDRTIIIVHGSGTNREDNDPIKGVRILDFYAHLAERGFAILALDMRGHGESAPAPLSFGEYEQRDVLGAADFLRSDQRPYKDLGPIRVIGGWGVSMGGATLLLAAEHEPAIRAVVTDCAFAEIVPLIQRDLPKQSGLPSAFTPGVLAAIRVLYGVDYAQARPLTDIAMLSGRSALFITVSGDQKIPPSDSQRRMADAARAAGALASTWLVQGGQHCNSYILQGGAYVDRVVDFYTTALGPDAHAA